MEEKTAEVKVAGSTANGHGGAVVQNYNACPMGVKLGDKVTVVMRLDAKKNGSYGGWGGDNRFRYEGSVDGWKGLGMDAGYMTNGAAVLSAGVGRSDSWIWKLLGGVVAAAVLIAAIMLAINLCSDKMSTVPGTTTKTVSSTFVPAQPAAPPAPQIIAVQGANGQNGQNGHDGVTGPIGPQGPKGDKGDLGATGSEGPQGPQGEQGLAGPQGPAGKKGRSGRDGTSGVDGAAGSAGPQGPAGQDGISAGSLTVRVINDGQYELSDPDDDE